jgi:hypothetical protein
MAKKNLVLKRYDFSRVGDGVFSAPVTLPVGRKIVSVTYYHIGTLSPYSNLRIMRAKTGEVPEKLGNNSSTDAAGTPIAVDVPITGDQIIRGAYRYYILVSVSPSSTFERVKIDYRE